MLYKRFASNGPVEAKTVAINSMGLDEVVNHQGGRFCLLPSFSSLSHFSWFPCSKVDQQENPFVCVCVFISLWEWMVSGPGMEKRERERALEQSTLFVRLREFEQRKASTPSRGSCCLGIVTFHSSFSSSSPLLLLKQIKVSLSLFQWKQKESTFVFAPVSSCCSAWAAPPPPRRKRAF